MELKVEARQLHLGGFIGDGTGEATCMGEKVQGWEGVQIDYTSMRTYLQQEWAFFKCTTPVFGS